MTTNPPPTPDTPGPTQDPPSPPAPDPPRQGMLTPITELVVEVGVFSTYLTLLVFVTGWSYGDRWFAELGLNISGVQGIQTETYSGWALWVIEDVWPRLFLLSIVVFFVGGWILIRTLAQDRVRLILSGSLAFAAVAALVGAGYLGASMAARQVPALFANERPTFKRVRVVAQKDTILADFFAAHGNLGTSTCLRKVFMDQQHLYVYAGYKGLEGRIPNVYILPLEDIAIIETIRNPNLCDAPSSIPAEADHDTTD